MISLRRRRREQERRDPSEKQEPGTVIHAVGEPNIATSSVYWACHEKGSREQG